MVWRDPFTLQFGIDEPLVILPNVDEPIERMIAALSAGISHTGLTMLGGESAERLVATVCGVMEVAPPRRTRVVVVGTGVIAEQVATLLAAEHCDVTRAATTDAAEPLELDLGVVVADYIIDPLAHSLWLRRDVPHVAAVIGDSLLTISGFVEPGVGPCLHCAYLWRCDDDHAWRAIATQALGRATRVSALEAAEAAAAITRVVLGRIRYGAGTAVQHTIRRATGERVSAAVAVHPDCGCTLDLSAEVPPETGSAAAQTNSLAAAQPTTESVVTARA